MELAKTVLSPSQAEAVQCVVAELRQGQQTLLGHVESERARLTSREAEQRSAALNELCAVILELLAVPSGVGAGGILWENGAINKDQIDQLLPFLLSKVEDCGHLSDMLITTLHQIIRLYDGAEHVLPSECLDRTITALFDGGGSVQSYGQRDRLLLFSCLGHLVTSHGPLLRSAIGAQRVLLAFIHAAQGEREPRALAQVFSLHQRMSANFSMGVLTEDMFELVACYFPIDYEPSDQEQAEPMPITREQLRHASECALLGHAAFAPFCMQLIAEKLLETEGGDDGTVTTGEDGSALIRRQLEICEFFIRVCTKFRDAPNSVLHEHVDDLMTAVRLLFLNPAVQQRETTLLKNITATIEQMLRVLASTLEHNSAKLEDPIRYIRQMAETSIENVEPFVLQAEMGTSGRAFCLLRCLALAHSVTRALCVPRALYWLNTLIRGQTLRSADNRAEIATEALALVPEWLRLCFVADGFGVFTARCDAQNASELISATVVPLFDSVRHLQSICEPDVLLAVECEAHSVLLLSLDTVPSLSPEARAVGVVGSLQQNNDQQQQVAQLRTLCSAMAKRVVLPLLTTTETFDEADESDALIRNVVQQTDNAKWGRLSTVLKQFIALSAHLTTIGDRMDERGEHQLVLPDPNKWPRLLELLPALVRPLSDELEGRKWLRKPLSDVQTKFSAAIGSLLLSTLSTAASDTVACAACAGVREMAQRLALAPPSDTAADDDGTAHASAVAAAHQCFVAFAERQLIDWVADWAQQQQQNNDDDQMGFRRADRIAQLLQDIGILALNLAASSGRDGHGGDGIAHTRMCAKALAIICQQNQQQNLAVNGVLLRTLRCFWLLFLLQSPPSAEQGNVSKLNQFGTVLLDTLKIVVGVHSAIGTAAAAKLNEKQLMNTAEQHQHLLIDALLCAYFALINSKSDDESVAESANNNLMEQTVVTNASDSSFSLPLLRLRFRAVETRNVLLVEPNAAIVAEQLKQFFNHFMALSDADSAEHGAQVMADLLDLHRPSTCPERCNFRRTLFWRQRLFCQFVPIFVQFARSSNCSSTKRRVLLQLLGPLLQIVDPQHITIDTVLNEFGQLHPVLVDALVDALAPPAAEHIGNASSPPTDKQMPTEQSSSSPSSYLSQQLLPLLLDVLCTLLQQMPPARDTDGFVALVPRLVHALTVNIARQTLLVQSKVLECLRLLAVPRLAIPPEALLPLHVCVVRAGAVLAASHKRLIRQRMARARNAWELTLA